LDLGSKVQVISSVMRKIRFQYTNSNYYNIQQVQLQKPSYERDEKKEESREMKRVVKNFYEVKSSLLKGSLVTILLELEQRLDIVLVRMNLTQSIVESRQLINHKHVKVNEVIVRIPSYKLNNKDKIEVTKSMSSKQIGVWKEMIAIPPYLEVDYQSVQGIYLRQRLLNYNCHFLLILVL
jgi:ribosomal protein S4